MLTGTGGFSLILYLSFIIIAIFGLFFLYHMLIKTKVENEKMDKLIDLFKTVIFTTAISTVGLIIADLFKEREYDKNEMQAFNEYIPYVVDTGTIDKKLALCEFFVAVTPRGDLQKAWVNWHAVLEDAKEKDISVDKAIRETVETYNSQRGPTTGEQLATLEQLETEKQKNLANVVAIEPTTYLVILSAYKTISEARMEVERAKAINQDATIYKKRNWYRIVIPVNTSWQDAKATAERINGSANRKVAYVVS